MFGLGFGEMVVLVVVAVVVVGPKDLPRLLRNLGMWAGKARRTLLDLRVQSGIDDVLKHEGLAEDIAEIRRLARGEMDHVVSAARVDAAPADEVAVQAAPPADEYPTDGPDSYGCLPDSAPGYADLPASVYASDPVYLAQPTFDRVESR